MKTLIVVFSWRDSELTNSCINWWKPHLNKKTELLVVYSDVKQDEKKKEGFITHWRIKDHPGMGMLSLMVYNEYVYKYDYFVRNDNDFRLKNIDCFWAAMHLFHKEMNWSSFTGRLFYPDGGINYSGVKYNYYGGKPRLFDGLSPEPTDTFLGAFAVFKTSSLRELGRWFDPNIILFGEELEVSLALQSLGKDIIYFPSVEGVHRCNGSINSQKFIYTELQFINQYYIFRRYRNFIERNCWLIRSLITLGYRERFNGLKLFYKMIKGDRISLSMWHEFLRGA